MTHFPPPSAAIFFFFLKSDCITYASHTAELHLINYYISDRWKTQVSADPSLRLYACACVAKLFSKMLSGGQNPQLHTVTLHLACGIRNGGERGLERRGAQTESEQEIESDGGMVGKRKDVEKMKKLRRQGCKERRKWVHNVGKIQMRLSCTPRKRI